MGMRGESMDDVERGLSPPYHPPNMLAQKEKPEGKDKVKVR